MSRIARGVFMVGIIVYLVLKMTEVGWVNVLNSLPTSPFFYLIFLLLYFSLPITESFIYKLTWRFPLLSSIAVFVKKRVYNKDVLGYSGEVYLYSWARKNVALSEWQILKTIRDNNILSSIASTAIAIILLIIFISTGRLNVSGLIGRHDATYIIMGVLCAVVVLILAIRFRRYIFSMPARLALIILGTHSGRLIVGNGLQILMWEAAIPEIDLTVWFTFAAASIIVSRIPFVPNRDLIMLGTGIELAELLDLSSADITGLFVTMSVLGKAMNLVWFVVVSIFNPGKIDEGSDRDDHQPVVSGDSGVEVIGSSV